MNTTKRYFAILMAFVLMVGCIVYAPSSAFAAPDEEPAGEVLGGGSVAFSEASAESAGSGLMDGSLGGGSVAFSETFAATAGCAHVHDANCGYIEGVPCGHAHDESCGEDGSRCAHVHDANCGYTEGAECGHVCDENCLTPGDDPAGGDPREDEPGGDDPGNGDTDDSGLSGDDPAESGPEGGEDISVSEDDGDAVSPAEGDISTMAAGATATINVSTLGATNASGGSGKTAWTYTAGTTRRLTLSGAGPYVLTGTNTNLRISITAGDAAVTFKDLIAAVSGTVVVLDVTGGKAGLRIAGKNTLTGRITMANNRVKMDDKAILTLVNTDLDIYFEKSATANTHKWNVTGGDSSGSENMTDPVIFVYAPPGSVPTTIERVPLTNAPEIFGPASKTLQVGYAATSTGAFTIHGNPAPKVTLSYSNDGGKGKWNKSTGKLDIAKGLTVGNYIYVLNAESSRGDTMYVYYLKVVPKTVTKLKATVAGHTEIMLSWDHVAGAGSYEVWRADSANGEYTKLPWNIGAQPSVRDEGCWDMALTTGKTYYYKARAIADSAGNYLPGAFSAVVSAKPVPNPVRGVTATSLSHTSIQVGWDSVTAAAGYEVWRATSSGGKYTMINSSLEAQPKSFTNTGLTGGQTYYYKIRAYINTVAYGKVYGPYSAVVKEKPVPGQVIGAIASSAGHNSVKVAWNQVANASGYEIFRATSHSGKYARVGTVTKGTTLSFTSKGLTTNKLYWYKVRAYRTISGAKVYGAHSIPTCASPIFGNLAGLTAASAGYNSIKVSWNNLAGASGYEVWRAESAGGAYTKIKTVTSGGTKSFTNKNLSTGKEYFYKALAYKTVSGKKVYSQNLTVAADSLNVSVAASARPIPAKPGGMKAAKTGVDSVKISWNKVAGASGYEVYRSLTKDGAYSYRGSVNGGGALNYTDTGLATGTNYFYKARAYILVSGSNYSGEFGAVVSAAPALTKPATVSGTKAASAGHDSIKITWSQANGASGYEVWRAESSGGSYALAGTATGAAALSYTDTGRTTGKAYYYKVRAYAPDGAGKLYGSYSAVANAKPQPAAVSGAKAESGGPTSVIVSWNSVAGASGYEVHRAAKKDGTYSKVKTVSGGSVLSYTNTGLTTGTPYFYKVRAFKSVSGSNVSGAFSSIVGATPIVSKSPTAVSIAVKSGSAYGATLPVGGTCALEAKITPSTATVDTAVTWSSNKTSVATVNAASGLVTAVAAGDATITAKTANGKTATKAIKVAPAVASISFASSSYEVKPGQTVNVAPTILPAGAYNVLTVSSGSTAIATVTQNSGGSVVVKGVAAGTVTITARSHNNFTGTFQVQVKPALENVLIQNAVSSTRAMVKGENWDVPLTLTPTSAMPDYTLTSTNTGVLRIDGNKTAVGVSAGSAKIEAKIGGTVKSTCTVTVTAPSYGKPALMLDGVKYEAKDKAALLVRVTTTVPGATYYVYAEHNNYTDALGGVNPKSGRAWKVSASQAASQMSLPGWTTGLRFLSCTAFNSPESNYSATNPLGGAKMSFIGYKIPAIYYVRNVGGAGSPGDGYCQAMSSAYLFGAYEEPWGMNFTFDQIPNVVGYQYRIISPSSGQDISGAVAANGSQRGFFYQARKFYSGTTTVYIAPFVYDTDGVTRVYGQERTVIFEVFGCNWKDGYGYRYFWENSESLNWQTITVPMSQL